MLTCENKAHTVFAKFPSITNYVKDVLVFTPLPYTSIHPLQLHHFPNGYPGIYIQQQDNSLQLQFQNKLFKLPKIFLYGQNTLPKKSVFQIKHKLIIVHLHPESLKLLFKVAPSQWVDEYIDLQGLNDPISERFYDRFYNSENLNEKLNSIANFINLKAQDADSIKYGKPILTLLVQNPSLTVSELSEKLCTTPRTLQRFFKNQIGLSPSTYTQIAQFQKAIKELTLFPKKSFSQVALHANYADQAHFNRSFKKYTGLTPSEYLKPINNEMEPYSHTFLNQFHVERTKFKQNGFYGFEV